MTDRQIEQARKELPCITKRAEWTNEQKRIDRELSCREMINSILCYNCAEVLEGNAYLKKYIEELGSDTVNRLCSEQIEDFNKAIVKKDVYRDGEGVSYNSIIWGDERSVDDMVADANQRSAVINGKDVDLKVNILQVKEGPKYALERFSPLRYFENGTESIKFENYDNIYSYGEETKLDFSNDGACADFLEGVYTTFNLHHPEDFRGHSLSVSDVVVLSNGSDCKAFYCDSIGFEELPEKFVKEFLESVEMQKATDCIDFDI